MSEHAAAGRPRGQKDSYKYLTAPLRGKARGIPGRASWAPGRGRVSNRDRPSQTNAGWAALTWLCSYQAGNLNVTYPIMSSARHGTVTSTQDAPFCTLTGAEGLPSCHNEASRPAGRTEHECRSWFGSFKYAPGDKKESCEGWGGCAHDIVRIMQSQASSAYYIIFLLRNTPIISGKEDKARKEGSEKQHAV